MKSRDSKSETFSALALAALATALCLAFAQQVKLWDMDALRAKIERVFAVDLTTALPPPPPRTQTEETALAGESAIGRAETMFARRPDNPEGAMPEVKLDALRPPSLPAPELDLAPPAPDLPAMAARSAVPEPAAPEALGALRRRAAAEVSPGALAGVLPADAAAYRPAAPRMAPLTPRFPLAAPEIAPRFMEPDAAPRLADISLPVPTATTLRLRDLVRDRPAGGYPSLERDLVASLEYSPRGADGKRCFRLSFRLRPESALPPIPKDVLFLIDVSQSIEGNQIRAMREAIGEYVRALRPGDRWNVVKFSEKIYPFRKDFIAAGEPLPPDFARFFARPLNEYMTDLFEATRVVLQGLPPDARPCNVFLVTDGFATYGRKEVDQLLSGFRRVNRDRFSLLPFMLGDKGMADLLRLLAYSSRGFFRRQMGGKDAAAAEMLAFFRDYDRPVLFACVANFTGLDGKEVYPEVLPNLYHGQAVTFHGRAEMAPGALVRVIGWGPGHAPREFYFRPEQGRAYPTGDDRIRREWAYGAAMDHVQAIVEAPDAAARAAKLAAFRAFLARHGLDELREMANLLEKNR